MGVGLIIQLILPVNSVVDAATLGLGTLNLLILFQLLELVQRFLQQHLFLFLELQYLDFLPELLLCDSDDLSAILQFDLNSHLTGEDAGGTWADNNGTRTNYFFK